MRKGFGVSRREFARLASVGAAMAAAGCTSDGIKIGSFELTKDDLGPIGDFWASFSMTDEEQKSLGEESYGPLVDQTGGRYANRAVQANMDRFAASIFETTERPFDWEVVVIDNDEPNAWALIGGKLAVNKGLLRYVANEHELAAVVAHEMGHAEESHHVSEIRRGELRDKTIGGVQSFTQSTLSFEGEFGERAREVAGVAVTKLVSSAASLALYGYSRGAEGEADDHILKVFRTTEHDPDQATGFFNTLLELIPEKSQSKTSLFSGHPETKKRIDEIKEKSNGLRGKERTALNTSFMRLKEPFPTRLHYRRNKTAGAV